MQQGAGRGERDGVVAVAVSVDGAGLEGVLRVVEGTLGWPVVAVDDPLLPPRVVLEDVPAALRRRGSPAAAVAASLAPAVAGPVAPRRLLLVATDDDPLDVARAAVGAADVLVLPPDPARLRAAVAAAPAPAEGRLWCTVAGSGGGVGATTVAAAIAGVRAWRHGPTLLAATTPTHAPDAPPVSDVAGPAVWAAARPAAGVRDLRVVRVERGAPLRGETVPTVVDLGVLSVDSDVPPDVLVVRADAAGLAAVQRAHPGAVVQLGTGPTTDAIASAVGGGVVRLPWSARVGAAAAAGRLPADAPGRWLAPLVPLADRSADALGAAAAGPAVVGPGPVTS